MAASPSSPSLSGRTAVVTGASSGIGRAIAESLGGAGAHVVMGGRTPEAMEESLARITAAGGSGEVRVHDVRDVAEARALVDQAVSSTGRLDVMVNNAGVSYPGTIVDADPEQWRTMLETNVFALLVGSQAAVRAMRACHTEDGHIVNISSVASLNPASGVYGATKHAVRCINETLRRELQDEPIKVVSIMPGAIATSFARNFDPAVLEVMVSSMGGGASTDFTQGQRLPDEVLAQAQRTMADHLCAPEDVAEAVLWSVTRPAGVHLAELVVRPKKDLNL